MGNRQEVIRDFLSRGKLLTPDALEMIMKGKSADEMETGILLTGNDLSNAAASNFHVLRNITEKKNDLSAEDFTRFYRSKFEKISEIITAKSGKGFVSINNASAAGGEIHTIGMVRAIKESGDKRIVELEDTTGLATAIFDKKDTEGMELDDVVAVTAVQAGNTLLGKQIIFPDVPLRKPAIGIGRACFIANLCIDEAPGSEIENFFLWTEAQDFNYIFVAGNVSDTEKFAEYAGRYCAGKTIFFSPGEKEGKEYPQHAIELGANIVSLSNPAVVEAGGLKILLAHKFDASWLKKRYLGRTSSVYGEDPLVLGEVPDIVCFAGEYPQVANYKSITMVSSGSMLTEFRPVVVDFSTREAVQIRLERR